MNFLRLLVIAGLVVLATCHGTVAGDYVKDDPLGSEELTQAIDAAITTLLGTKDWFKNLKAKHNYTNAHQVMSCTPHDTRWKWPDRPSAGLLQRVFDSGELKVAGVKWEVPGVADYKTDPANPTGFWPEFLSEIVRVFDAHYGTTTKITRMYHGAPGFSAAAIQSVADGVADMSEPYYQLAGFHGDKPRIEALLISCTTLGTTGQFFVNPSTFGSVLTMDALNAAIEGGSNKKVGFIAKGNHDSVQDVLSPSAVPVFTADLPASDSVAAVLDGTYVAMFVNEGNIPGAGGDSLVAIETDTIAPRVAFFRRDVDTCDCPAAAAPTCGTSGGSPGVTINMFNSGSGVQGTC